MTDGHMGDRRNGDNCDRRLLIEALAAKRGWRREHREIDIFWRTGDDPDLRRVYVWWADDELSVRDAHGRRLAEGQALVERWLAGNGASGSDAESGSESKPTQDAPGSTGTEEINAADIQHIRDVLAATWGDPSKTDYQAMTAVSLFLDELVLGPAFARRALDALRKQFPHVQVIDQGVQLEMPSVVFGAPPTTVMVRIDADGIDVRGDPARLGTDYDMLIDIRAALPKDIGDRLRAHSRFALAEPRARLSLIELLAGSGEKVRLNIAACLPNRDEAKTEIEALYQGEEGEDAAEALRRRIAEDLRQFFKPPIFPALVMLLHQMPAEWSRFAGLGVRLPAELRQRVEERVRELKAAKEAKDPVDKETTWAEITSLAKLNTLDYQRERDAAARALGLTKVVLDKLVRAQRQEEEIARHTPREIEPWPAPVDGAALLDEITAAIQRHVILGTHEAYSVALWVLYSHAYDAFPISPRLAITSPTAECGKTSLLVLVGDHSQRPVVASSVTAAIVFRVIDKWHPTFLMDELDTFLPENEELRGVINSGHAKRAAVVYRTVGDDHEPRGFSSWTPVVLALIGKLPPTLESRSIPINLQRKLPGQRVARYKSDKQPYLDLARKAARWGADNFDALRNAEPAVPEAITGRRADNWEPLIAVADLGGGEWPQRARAAALAAAGITAGHDLGIMMLADIRRVLGARDQITSEDLAAQLARLEGQPWADFGKSGRAISRNAIARLLKPFGIAPGDLWIKRGQSGRSAKGYKSADFTEAFERYLPTSYPEDQPLPSDGQAKKDVPPKPPEGLADEGGPLAGNREDLNQARDREEPSPPDDENPPPPEEEPES
jgi:putative DNA primase/helicase